MAFGENDKKLDQDHLLEKDDPLAKQQENIQAELDDSKAINKEEVLQPSPAEGKEEKDEVSLLKAKLEEKKKEAESNFDRLIRLQAEFENYKKRVWKEQQEYFKYSQESLMKDLLPIIDNLDRAIKAAQKSSNTQALLEGVQLIHTQIKDILSKWELKEIEATGQLFDPSRHEALMVVESDTHQENYIVEEIEKGYLLKDRIIRPSKVIVAKKKNEEDLKEED